MSKSDPDVMLSAHGAPSLPERYGLTDIRKGRATVTFVGFPIGKLIRKRGGVGVGSWGFTIGYERKVTEGGFNTRSAAAYYLYLVHDNAVNPPAQPDVIWAQDIDTMYPASDPSPYDAEAMSERAALAGAR